MSSGPSKAEQKAEQTAREQTQRAEDERSRLEDKFGLQEGELEREGRLFELEKTIQDLLQGRLGRDGETLLKEVGPETAKLFEETARRGRLSGEELFDELGPTAKKFADDVRGDEFSLLEPELERSRMFVNQQANRRGVFEGLPEGGIRFEQLGRAAIDKAVAASQERLNRTSSIIDAFSQIQTGARTDIAAASDVARGEQTGSREEALGLMRSLQGVTTSARGRATNVGVVGSRDIVNPANQDEFGVRQTLIGRQAGREDNRNALLGDLALAAINPAAGATSAALRGLTSASQRSRQASGRTSV